MPAVRPDEIARISAALVSALADAQEMAKTGNVGSDFASLMQHVRDMYALLDDSLQSAGDAVTPEARAVAARLGAAIAHMEQLLQEQGIRH